MAKPKSPENASRSAQPSISPSSLDFLDSFEHCIRIDISAPSTDPNRPYELLQLLRLKVICALNETAVKSSAQPFSVNLTVAFWPCLFVFSAGEAEQSASVRQHRGCFTIGLDIGEREAKIVFTMFKTLFNKYVRSHRIFVDEPVEPKLEVRLVRKAELGRLVIDNAIWPQPNAKALIIRNQAYTFEVSTDYYAPTEEHLANSTTKCSPHPKLRPATDVLHRLRWDADFKAEEYAVIYMDRFTGYQEIAVASWKSDTSDDEFVPLHRIVSFRSLKTGEIIWSRELRIDQIFNS
jgi:uncharacterized protein (UPF0248 family)